MSARKMCFDRILPRRLRQPQRTREGGPGRERAIAPQQSVWVNGSTIRIRFLEGDDRTIQMVQDVAARWTEHANLNFVFTDDPRAQIRVTFDATDGAWSYVGTDNLEIPLHASTLNLGWVDEAVILHEFGHMIGLSHEHQNPDGGIEWNEEVVLRELAGPPNYWDEATTRHNVLRKYGVDQLHGTKFDPESIMLYAVPGEWTRNLPEGTHENEDLSQTDRDFVRSAKMYPGRDDPEDRATPLEIHSWVESDIEAAEEELYSVEVQHVGRYVFETEGATDVVMAVFGPDAPTRLVARDDDGGVGFNSKIVVCLEPGRYFVQVRHYDPSGEGAFRLRVSEI